jgi:hypothetical protein
VGHRRLGLALVRGVDVIDIAIGQEAELRGAAKDEGEFRPGEPSLPGKLQ